MQVNTGADSTVMSLKNELGMHGKPQLDGKIRHLEAYDSIQLTPWDHSLMTLSGTEAGTNRRN